jgi:hypothetical protein
MLKEEEIWPNRGIYSLLCGRDGDLFPEFVCVTKWALKELGVAVLKTVSRQV